MMKKSSFFLLHSKMFIGLYIWTCGDDIMCLVFFGLAWTDGTRLMKNHTQNLNVMSHQSSNMRALSHP